MNQKDYYQILGVAKSAPQNEIRQAYRKLAFQFHPDKNLGNPSAGEKMKDINEAYATLSNPSKRREYDLLKEKYGEFAYDKYRQTHSQEDIFRGSDINQVFNEFARMYGFRNSDDILKQFYGQGYQTFQFRRSGIFGTGFVFYYPQQTQKMGGNQSSIKNQEDLPIMPFPGILGGLFKTLIQRGMGIQFPEKGKDGRDTISISPELAAGGGDLEYIYNKFGIKKNLLVKIPAGISSSQKIRLKAMGATGKNGGPPGDFYLEIRINVPLLSRMKNIFRSG
jgi:DnaJ-class molecular chaperone